MFARLELAVRIERAEGEFSASVARALRGVEGTGAMVRPIGGGVSAFARPGSPMNKIVGVGFEGPMDGAALGEIEAEWRRRGEGARLELSAMVDASVLDQISARGYRLVAFESVLGRGLAARPVAARPMTAGGDSEIAIEVVGESAASVAAWGRVAVEGFARPDGSGAGTEAFSHEVLEQAFGDLRRAEGLRCYLARIGGVPVGAATVRLGSGLAQLAGATTLVDFRGRGVQTALLARRLEDAARAGCDLAVVTTAPGSRSQENVQRHGFELLYARAILVQA
jgi:predicted GNAT family acetyltransferase